MPTECLNAGTVILSGRRFTGILPADMTTKLEGPLKRELAIDGDLYTVTISPEGFKLVPKGRRKGYELDWRAFVSGEAALATALNASLARAPETAAAPPPKQAPKRRGKARKS